MGQAVSKDNQPDRTDIAFAVLLLLTWTLLAWFGQEQEGRLPLALAGVASLCVLFSYSVAFTGNCLTRIGWTSPQQQWYWLLGVASGGGGSCAVVLFLWVAGRPLPIRELRLPAFVLAVTVGPILEEVIFRGLILSGLLYALARLCVPQRINVMLSILAAALLFGLAHHGRSGVALLETILMGSLYGWLRVQSGSTAVAAAAHSGFNLILHLFLV